MEETEADPSQFPSQLHEIEDGSTSAPADDNQPGDEAPAAKGKVHQFYLPKLHPYEDPELESKIKEADAVIRKSTKARDQIIEKIEFRKMDNDNVRCIMHRRRSRFLRWSRIDSMKRDLCHLEQSLHKLSLVNNSEWEKRAMKEVQRRLVHERPSQVKERQIFREHAHLVETRQSAQAEEKAEIIRSLGTVDQIQNSIEWTEQQLKHAMQQEERPKCVVPMKEKDLQALERKVVVLNEAKAKAQKRILDSNRMQATIRADYEEYVATLNTAKELAMKKDVTGLEEFINRENERFMWKWNNDKRFKQVYKKRVASSLDARGLNWDGRLISPQADELSHSF